MAQEPNATCAVCGKPYVICRTCKEITQFKPWRTVADTVNCYQIFAALSKYNSNHNKQEAQEALSRVSLEGRNTFVPAVQKLLDEILGDSKRAARQPIKRKPVVETTAETVPGTIETAQENNSECE